MEREKCCCFTGHRRIPEQEMLWVRRRLREEILDLAQKGVDTFLTGGALGFDTLAAQEVLRMRAMGLPSLKLVLALQRRYLFRVKGKPHRVSYLGFTGGSPCLIFPIKSAVSVPRPVLLCLLKRQNIAAGVVVLYRLCQGPLLQVPGQLRWGEDVGFYRFGVINFRLPRRIRLGNPIGSVHR